jgi:hypothetical protein
MVNSVKKIGTFVLGLAIFLAVCSVPLVFIKGAMWASDNLLPPLITVGWYALAVDLVLLLPLSMFRRLRAFTGAGMFLSSFLFGLITWLSGFVITYMLWGIWAVIIGVVFIGVGVVPMALLATLLKGLWGGFLPLLVLVVLTFGLRGGGLLIAESGET